MNISSKTNFEQEVIAIEKQVNQIEFKDIPKLSMHIQEVRKDYVYMQKRVRRKMRKVGHKERLYPRLKKHEKQIKHWIGRLDVCQSKLEKKYHTHESSFQSGGQYNPYRVIQGSDHIPTYGGIAPIVQEERSMCAVDFDTNMAHQSEGWIPILRNGTISAGTWQYPSGGMHLGLDVAAPMFSSIYAPANGLVLYADGPVDSNNGYLGNFCGWPLGGGNSIFLVIPIHEKLFGVSLCHLSNQIYVVAGQQVIQGDVIALSGNSGNSTGPHTHIEVFQIDVSLDALIQYFSTTADFSLGNGFDHPSGCSSIACRVRPEEVISI